MSGTKTKPSPRMDVLVRVLLDRLHKLDPKRRAELLAALKAAQVEGK